jgi:hypothetical protein
VLWDAPYYRDKKVVGVFVRFRAPLQPPDSASAMPQVVDKGHFVLFAQRFYFVAVEVARRSRILRGRTKNVMLIWRPLAGSISTAQLICLW